MRWAIVAATYLASLIVVALVSFGLIIFVAGPHSGLLPRWAENVALALGWLSTLIVPIVLARAVWRRVARDQRAR